MRLTIVMTGVLLLAGCATTPPPAELVDTFCLTARKRSWSIHDTPETIRDVTAWNTLVDRKCGYPAKVASK